MNQDIKEKWVAALRSGDYEQGESCLCRIDDSGAKKYCCLGVLSDLAVKEGIIPEPKITAALNVKFDGNTTILGERVANWAGISYWGTFDHFKVRAENGNDASDLTELNDNGDSFEKIADVIDQHF